MCLDKRLNQNRKVYWQNNKIIGLKKFGIRNSSLYSVFFNDYKYKFTIKDENIVSIIDDSLQEVNYSFNNYEFSNYRNLGYHISSFNPDIFDIRFHIGLCVIPIFFHENDIQDVDGIDIVVQRFSLMTVKEFNCFINNFIILDNNGEIKSKNELKKTYKKLYEAIVKEIKSNLNNDEK